MDLLCGRCQSGVPAKILCAFLITPVAARFPAHRRPKFRYFCFFKLLKSFSLRNILKCSLTSGLLRPDMSLSTLF